MKDLKPKTIKFKTHKRIRQLSDPAIFYIKNKVYEVPYHSYFVSLERQGDIEIIKSKPKKKKVKSNKTQSDKE